jgi:hypothetical protein
MNAGERGVLHQEVCIHLTFDLQHVDLHAEAPAHGALADLLTNSNP